MWLFYKELMKKRGNIGACAPSTPLLAKAIAQALPNPLDGIVLELGPGTGAITSGLVKHGIRPEQIITIEFSAHFTVIMKKKFPNILTINGSAEQLSELIQPIEQPITAIVSSLPLRILPNKMVKTILREIDKVLQPGGYYIQYTYSKKSNPITNLNNYRHIKSKHVLLNLPPARTDVFVKKYG
jgi:phosphatidylethanolamine/phosphatidyl-N-methylethanolamine N-methyltransferase